MTNDQTLYTQLFNAVTDALNALDRLNVGQAGEILRQAQVSVEEQYLSEKAADDQK